MTGPPQDYSLLLPPGWVRLPLDDRAAERVARLVNTQVEHLPAERREAARQGMTKGLRTALAEAARAGGVDLFLGLRTRTGRPLAASCLVTVLQRGDSTLSDVADGVLLDGVRSDALDVSVVELAGSRAVRRERTMQLPVNAEVAAEAIAALDGDVPPDAALPRPVVTEVSYFVDVPRTDGMLVFSFTSAIPELSAPLVALYDAIAESLRWHAADGSYDVAT